MRVTDGQTDGRTDVQKDRQNYDSQDRASIAASRGKKWGGQAASSGRMGAGIPNTGEYGERKLQLVGNSSSTDGHFVVNRGKRQISVRSVLLTL